MKLGRLLFIVCLISGCTVGPRYTRPDVQAPIPQEYKETAGVPQGSSQWKPADPSDDVDRGDWWYNLRPSNTEPLLRLNVEAANESECARHVDEVLALVAELG